MATKNQIISIDSGDLPANLSDIIENGDVLFFPAFPFQIDPSEQQWLNPSWADPKHKNISLNPLNGAFQGVIEQSEAQTAINALIKRYFTTCQKLVTELFPHYVEHIRPAPTSLRLHRVETRDTSWRKDDSRLHVDAFPSRPNYGERILRIFMNINPQQQPRVWRVGEPFENIAKHFLPTLPRQWPGSAQLLAALKITKSPRSEYDHLMLKLHDAMKHDMGYQKSSPQQQMPFPAGSGWVCFSDQTSHAVMSGQFMLEQTFFLPVEGMQDPAKAPLAILERLAGHALI